MTMVGRKPKYTPERIATICRAIENGETDETAAKIGGISVSCFYDWQVKHLDFLEAVKTAKSKYEEWQMKGILADAKRSLKTLICGLEYEETKTEYEDDPKHPGTPKIRRQTVINKKVMPNPTAVIFALCNRDPENWKNRHLQEIDGKITTETKTDLSLAAIPDDLLAQVIEKINGVGE